MTTAIERELFRSHEAHALLAISLSANHVVVTVAPWSNPTKETEAIFSNAELLSLWADSQPLDNEITLPWDIIGFDCYDQGEGRWRFGLTCHAVEFHWQSEWPRIS